MTFSNYDTILAEKTDFHLKIKLNRPEKRNALNGLMVEELNSVLSDAADDESLRTISIEGDEKSFCSGADLEYLKSVAQYSWDQNYEDSKKLSDLYLNIYTHSKPIIAVVNGPAIAGGCGLATVCDYVISTENGKFGYPEVKIGFVASIVSEFLIRQIGEGKARHLLLTGEIVNANKALELGMINEIVEETKLFSRVNEIIQNFKLCAPGSISSTKKLFATFNFTNLKKQVEQKARLNADFRQTDYFNEGVTAFLEKRKPNWTK